MAEAVIVHSLDLLETYHSVSISSQDRLNLCIQAVLTTLERESMQLIPFT